MAKTPTSRFRAAVNALFALALTVAAAPAFGAESPTQNLGPVGPAEPILVKAGTQRVIAFFTPDRGGCAVSAVTWMDEDAKAPYASARVRVNLKPGQMLALDGSQAQSMSLLCGADAATLAVVAPAELVLTGSTRHN
ncbi:MAG: hypothetical protein AB7V40_03050 [Methyloceanibacter sp.]